MTYHTAKTGALENELHEKQTQTSFKRSSRITYYGRTEKFKVFEFRALMGQSEKQLRRPHSVVQAQVIRQFVPVLLQNICSSRIPYVFHCIIAELKGCQLVMIIELVKK